MPVFFDTAFESRDLRVLRSFATPLPDYAPRSTDKTRDDSAEEAYDVVVVGAGPAGSILTLLLARYGLDDSSLLCIDAKPGTLKSGQADGLQPRTLEVLQSLGLAQEILAEGCHMWEVAFWNPTADGIGIERSAHVPDVDVYARFPHEVTIHQGRIERIFADDLQRYSKRGIQFSTKLVSVAIDASGGSEYPVTLQVETAQKNGSTVQRTVRARHLIGADGAHSVVRHAVGLELKGESRDHIWGVVDLVLDTDFPDIRRRTAIHSNSGSVMVIPRERIANGEYLTRLYVQMDEDEAEEAAVAAGDLAEQRRIARERRQKVTLEGIMAKANRVFSPFQVKLKDGQEVDWFAAYQIGQRMTEAFTRRDDNGVPRVFIVGDACHTHSPKAGQGMNVSFMDSYNLSWKLAYHLKGLASPEQTLALLDTYETERHAIARELIEFDTKFSSMFSGKIGIGDGDSALTHEQFLEAFSTGNGFTSGCGIEYPESPLVVKQAVCEHRVAQSAPYEPLRVGRRLANVRVLRHADGNPRDLQDDFPSNGRFRVLALASTDILDKGGSTAAALQSIHRIIGRYPPSLVELVVLHRSELKGVAWSRLPPAIKALCEMRFHSAVADSAPAGKETQRQHLADDAYAIYGVDAEEGAVAVVRPDGYIALISRLDDIAPVEAYFAHWLRASV